VPRPAISVQVISEDRDAGVLRQLVKYENEPGEFLEAYVLKPLKITGKLPGVVVLHSTSDDTIRQGAGLGSQPLKGFGLMMAQRGCVAICPKNFLWTGPRNDKGKYDFKATTAAVLRKYAPSLGMAKMLFDAQRAVDALVSLPEVDAARLGCIGHSLGGKEALYLPAFDDRIKTAVSSEGGVPMNSTNWHDPWYLGPAVKDPAFGHDHHELVALIAPRPWLLVGGESADGDKSWPYLEAARPVYELYGKPARLGMYNHRRGHVVDEEIAVKMCDWLSAYL
jgi:dienelactone hydrolase